MSLNSLLSRKQREDFVLLVADATDRMRARLHATFTYKQDDLVTAAKQLTVESTENGEDTEKLDTTPAPWAKDIQDPSLEAFDSWRTALLQRLGEVVNTNDSQESTKESTGKAQFPSTDDDKLIQLPPSIDTPLKELPLEYRAMLLNALLLLLLSLERYSPQSRTLLKTIAASLDLTPSLLFEVEAEVAGQLQKAADLSHQADGAKKNESSSSKWKIGLASVAGAALVGITGGLAAPLVAAGLGSVLGGIGLGGTVAAGYLGAMAGSSVLVGGLFGAYGAKMAGETMRKYAAEVEDFAFMPLGDKTQRLSVTIGISGWLEDDTEVTRPWTVLSRDVADPYALRYEVKALSALGTALSDLVFSTAFSYAKREIIRRTVLASLMAALWPLAFLKVGRILDNPWRIAFVRSQKAGVVLADALCEGVQGNRPVTLVGFSLGARVIFECCKELSRRRQFGVIESVVLMGAPVPSDASDWACVRSVCSGRVVNCYSESDYILGFLYRTASVQFGVAGLQKVDLPGIDNCDVSDLAKGHLRYRYLVGTILRERVGLEGVDSQAVRLQEKKLEELVEKEQAVDRQAESQVVFDADEKHDKDATKSAEITTDTDKAKQS
ncbi:hypothetical protein PYCC9005_005901 [Savitreella phatthalungensis]